MDNNYKTTTFPYQHVNAALTKCRFKRKVGTHPIPLPIRGMFFGLGYLARIAAKAHRHWNTTRQRQWIERISGLLCAITTILFISFYESNALKNKPTIKVFSFDPQQ